MIAAKSYKIAAIAFPLVGKQTIGFNQTLFNKTAISFLVSKALVQ